MRSAGTVVTSSFKDGKTATNAPPFILTARSQGDKFAS